MTDYFRVTVQDLRTGEIEAVEVADGDYMLSPFGSCVLSHLNGDAEYVPRARRRDVDWQRVAGP